MIKPALILSIALAYTGCSSSEIEEANKSIDSNEDSTFLSTVEIILPNIESFEDENNHLYLKPNFIKLVLSKELITKSLSKHEKSRSSKEIVEHFSIEEVDQTDILRLSFYDKDSTFALSFLDTHIEVICDSILNWQMDSINSAIQQIELNLDSLEHVPYKSTDHNTQTKIEKEYYRLLADKTQLTIDMASYVCRVKVITPSQIISKPRN